MVNENLVDNIVSEPYKYGFVTEIESEKISKGINEDIVRLISSGNSLSAFNEISLNTSKQCESNLRCNFCNVDKSSLSIWSTTSLLTGLIEELNWSDIKFKLKGSKKNQYWYIFS